MRVLLGVAVVAGACTLARRARAPKLLEPLAGALALGLYASFAFASSTLAAGLVPGPETVRALGDLIGLGLLDVEELAPPVPTNPGLVLLAVLGVGGLAVLVDLVAVTFRQPAVAGLPLLALFAVPAAVLPDGLGWLPFALGAGGWLGLLLADGSDAVSRWGTPLRTGASRDPSLGRVGRRIGATALGIAVVVPALLPGLDSRLLGGGTGGDGEGGARSTTTYNPILELGGQLRLPEPGRLLLRYTTDDPTPDYLRLTTLDRFDEETGWSSSELSADLQDDAVQDGIPVPLSTSTTPVQPVTTTVDLARLDGPWLPAPLGPRDVEVDGPWLWDEEAQTVFSTRVSLDDVDEAYVVRSERALPTPELLRQATGAPTTLAETYATPPAVSPYVTEVLDEHHRRAHHRLRQGRRRPGAVPRPEQRLHVQRGGLGRRLQRPGRAGELPARPAGLLRAVLLGDGRDGPRARHPGPRRRRLHAGLAGRGRQLGGDDLRRARVAGGLVRRYRLGALRADAALGAGDDPRVHDRAEPRGPHPDRERGAGRAGPGRLGAGAAGRAGPRRRPDADLGLVHRLGPVRPGAGRPGPARRGARAGRGAVAAGGRAPAPALAHPRAAGRLGAGAGRRRRRRARAGGPRTRRGRRRPGWPCPAG